MSKWNLIFDVARCNSCNNCFGSYGRTYRV